MLFNKTSKIISQQQIRTNVAKNEGLNEKATCRQTTLAIPRCSVNYELDIKVENHEISPGKRVPATQEGGPCGQAYGGKWGHGSGGSGRTGESWVLSERGTWKELEVVG
jgi:hypothetical protein